MAAWIGIEANTSSALAPAVAVSVALHVAVLAGVPDPANYSVDAPLAPLNARLAPAAVPPQAQAPASTATPVEREQARVAQPRAASQEPRRAAPPPRAAPSPLAAPAPAHPVTRDETAVAVAPDVPVNAAPVVAAARAEPGAASGEPAVVPRAAPDAIDPGSLGQYRLALLGAARRHKLYPEAARERGWEGRVAVELVIAADGSLAAAHVKHSSGHGVLDREALEMLRRAAALTPVPPSLQGREFRVDVPVLFELRNG
jgi:protein TonB